MSAQKIKISIVNYTNTLPFKWALKRNSILEKIDLQEDIPSICGQKLKFGQVDLALVPVALLPELDSYFISSKFCIGAKGKVDSVKLYSRVPLENIERVTLDYQSKSSITLSKVLFKFYWKLPVQFVEAKPGFEKQIEGKEAAVVIGDRTFDLNGAFAYEYDLAEEWEKFTGLPFVFAAWISRQKLDAPFVQEFDEVLEKGIQNLKTAVDEDYENQSLSKEETFHYLSERISYHFDSKKMEALELFVKYIQLL